MQTSTLVVSRRWRAEQSLLPGLCLTFTIAAVAFELRALSGIAALSPLIIAVGLGMAFHNTVHTPSAFEQGVVFSMRRILRFAIIMLGLQLSLTQVVAVGATGLGIIIATLTATFAFTVWLGRRLGVDRKLAQLIAAGTSICGASAVVATNTVSRASDEEVAYAVACVTVFGSVSMLLYPVLLGLLQLSPHAFGLWTGASIHEIAQVVAAAFQGGTDSGDFGTIVKLSRVMLLAPTILVLGYMSVRGSHAPDPDDGTQPRSRSIPIPWFVVGFIGMILFNSLDLIPPEDKAYIVQATAFLLTVALAAMGLQTDIRKLRAKGLRPLFVAAGSWVFISVFSLALIELARA
jgi:uncharacterized integral membrane protein (TIGR00698 family)